MFNDGFDIEQALKNKGLKSLDAKYVTYNISGIDKIFLINALLGNNTESDEIIRSILNEYNIEFEPEYKCISVSTNEDNFNVIVNVKDIEKYKHFLSDRSIQFKVKGDTFYIRCPDEQTSFILDEYAFKLNNKFKEDNMTKNQRSISDIKSKIQENKLGFSTMGSLGGNLIDFKRLSELAGLNEDDISDLGLDGSISIDSDPSIDQNQVIDVSDDQDHILGDQDLNLDTSIDVVPVTQSEAMSAILDALNSIQSQLPDIRLCEYKSLMVKVDELNTQIKAMGANYLNERKLRK